MKTKFITAAMPLALLGLLAACSTQPTEPTASSNSQPAATTPSPASVGSASASPASRGTMKVAKRSVYHGFDESDLKPEQRTTVEANAAYLREHPELKVRIEGNADER